MEFQDAARREGIVGGSDDVQWLFEAGQDGSGVDVREWFFEEPFIFCVVDLEGAVRWNVDGLNRGEVSSYDVGGGVGIG